MKINKIFFINEIQLIILNFGILTFIFGGIFSSSILDIKKAVAFSTLSQLGFIIFRIRIGNFLISFLHLIFHAFFKSSLFINLGYFINLNFSIQDSRQIDNFSNNLLFKLTFFISCINLMGFISLRGFFSKDLVLIFFFTKINKFLILLFLYLGCVFTGIYSIKFLIFLFNIKLINIKFIKNININIFFSKILISSIIILFIPNILLNLILLDLENFIFKSFKFEFYLIVLISFILIKFIIFYINKIMFYFSSILIILDITN
jgi:NADH:ubiquinone oxidoreductase subunit 5 (subunit L)/multisubunit Na+/H+ antiporter MnhA subunit